VRHTYGIVLVLVVLSFVVQEAAPDTDLTRVVIIWLQAATLAAAGRIAGANRPVVRLAAAVAALAAVAAPVLWVVEGSVGDGVAAIATGLLVGIAPLAIAAGLSRDLLHSGEVTVDILSGVLAIYLLAGMFFSFLFAAVQILGDDPFFAEIADPERSDYLYFSYTTLTSTGFGDLTAARNLGRTLTSIEALVGTIYLVTIVGLIVANLRPRRRTPGAAPAEEER
jgi:Ion channel